MSSDTSQMVPAAIAGLLPQLEVCAEAAANGIAQLPVELTSVIPSPLLGFSLCSDSAASDLLKSDARCRCVGQVLSSLGSETFRLARLVDLYGDGTLSLSLSHEATRQQLDTLVAPCALRLGLDNLVVFRDGQPSSQRLRGGLASALRLVGALALCADLPRVFLLLSKCLPDSPYPEKDYKTTLQELSDSEGVAAPGYDVVDASGPQHSILWRCRVSWGSSKSLSAEATGTSKKAAEQAAAYAVLEKLGELDFVAGPLRGPTYRLNEHVIPRPQAALLRFTQERLGYAFNDVRLLSVALTHRSVLNDPRYKCAPLDFFACVGAAILKWTALRELAAMMDRWWDRGADYAKAAAHVGAHEHTARIASTIPLRAFFASDKIEARIGHNEVLLAQLYQSCMAAVFFDAGYRIAPFMAGVTRLTTPVRRALEQLAAGGQVTDPKSLLQELAAVCGLRVAYQASESGPPHKVTWTASATLEADGRAIRSVGTEASKTGAEKAAAQALIAAFGQPGVTSAPHSHEAQRLVFRELVRTASRGEVGWRALAGRRLLGADRLIKGTREDVHAELGALYRSAVEFKSGDLLDSLLQAVKAIPKAAPSTLIPSLREFAGALTELLSGWSVVPDGPTLMSEPCVGELVVLSALAARLSVRHYGTDTVDAVLQNLQFIRFQRLAVQLDAVTESTRSARLCARQGLLLETLGAVMQACDDLAAAPTTCKLQVLASGQDAQFRLACEPRVNTPHWLRNKAVQALAERGGLRISMLTEVIVLECRLDQEPTDGRPAWVNEAIKAYEMSSGGDPYVEQFAHISHDLKNLLIAIDSRVAEAGGAQSGRYSQLAAAEDLRHRAREAATQMSVLLRAEWAYNVTVVNMRRLLALFLADLLPRLPAGVHLQTHLAADEIGVQGDADLIRSALDNICKNALDAMRGDGGLSVDWSYDATRTLASVVVRDTGPGFPSEVTAAVASGKLPPSVKHLAPGLGLASVAQVARAHGGTVEISNANVGAAVCLQFPAFRLGGSEESAEERR